MFVERAKWNTFQLLKGFCLGRCKMFIKICGREFATKGSKKTNTSEDGTGQLKCDGKRAEIWFRLSGETDESVQSTTGSRGVRISGSNAGYTMFRGSVKGTGYPLHSPLAPSLPPPVRHRVPSHYNWTLQLVTPCSEVVWWVLATHSIRQFTFTSPPVR